MAQNNERNPHSMHVAVASLAAGASIELPLGAMKRDAVIMSVDLIDQVGVAASGSNYVTATLKDHTQSINLAQGDTKLGVGAFVAQPIALIPSVGDAHEGGSNSAGYGVADTMGDKGSVLSVVLASTGTAVLTNARVVVTLHYL
jgi:hypothetical protein